MRTPPLDRFREPCGADEFDLEEYLERQAELGDYKQQRDLDNAMRKSMTLEDAERKALEWRNLHDDAECEAENGCEGAAIKLRDEARAIEASLEADGYNASQLIRQIQARRRAL